MVDSAFCLFTNLGVQINNALNPLEILTHSRIQSWSPFVALISTVVDSNDVRHRFHVVPVVKIREQSTSGLSTLIIVVLWLTLLLALIEDAHFRWDQIWVEQSATVTVVHCAGSHCSRALFRPVDANGTEVSRHFSLISP